MGLGSIVNQSPAYHGLIPGFLGSRPRGFSPLSILGIERWYTSADSSDKTTAASNGRLTITDWVDRTGNENAVAPSGFRPWYEKCSLHQGNDYYTLSDAALGTDNFSCFAVVQTRAIVADLHYFSSRKTTGDNRGFSMRGTTGGHHELLLDWGASETVISPPSTFNRGNYYSVFATVDRTGDAIVSFYNEDGTIVNTKTIDISSNSAVDLDTGENWHIGADRTVSTMDGWIREIGFIRGIMTADEITNTINYFKTTYSDKIPSNLGNCLAHYDVSNAASRTDISGAIAQLDDLSGNGYHLTQNDVAKRPTVVTGQNGLEGGDMTIHSSASLFRSGMTAPSGDACVILAIKMNNFGSSQSLFGIGNVTSGTHSKVGIMSALSGITPRFLTRAQDSAGYSTARSMNVTSEFAVVALICKSESNGIQMYTLAFGETSGTKSITINKQSAGDGQIDALSVSPSDRIGFNTIGTSADCEIYEAAILSGAVTHEDMFQVVRHFKSKYGVL